MLAPIMMLYLRVSEQIISYRKWANKMPPKYASPYSLVKQPIQQSSFWSIFDARNKQTGEIWAARVIRSSAIDQSSLSDQVEFNQEALLNMQEKSHIIYVKEIFAKGDTFLIQEKQMHRLSNYLSKKNTLPPAEVESIIQQVFEGLCEIYEEGYVHRGVRLEHLVQIEGSEDEPARWKIDTLVMDNRKVAESPFSWKAALASPEERNQSDSLDEGTIDAQIVWNLGMMAAQMLLGGSWPAKPIANDSEVPWGRLKQLTRSNPDLFQLLDRSLRANFKQRLPLHKLFGLKIFQICGRSDAGQYFMTASKIYKPKGGSFIQRSINLKGQDMRSKLVVKTKSEAKVIEEQQEQDDEGEKKMNRMRGEFLCGVGQYVKEINSAGESAARLNENKMLIDYYFLQLAKLYLETCGQTLPGECNSRISNQSRIVKRVKPSDNPLLAKLALPSNPNLKQMVGIFNSLCGYAYSRLRQDCQLNDTEPKGKALSYFGLAAYVVNINNWQQPENLPLGGVLSRQKKPQLFQFFKNFSTDEALRHSQSLVRKHFRLA